MEKLEELKNELLKQGVDGGKIEYVEEDGEAVKLKIGYKEPAFVKWHYCERFKKSEFLLWSAGLNLVGDLAIENTEECAKYIVSLAKKLDVENKSSDWKFNDKAKDEIIKVVDSVKYLMNFTDYAKIKQRVKNKVDEIVPDDADNDEWNKAIDFAYSYLFYATEEYCDN